MKMSNSIKELASALSKAQATFGSAKKSAYNPFHKSNYSDLNDINDVIKKPLSDNGLSYSQFPICDGEKYGVETILMHSSGEWMCEKFILEPSKPGPQASVSCISYARRYALIGILGIPSYDDDGNSASQNNSSSSPKNKKYTNNTLAEKHAQKPEKNTKYIPPTKDWVSKCTDVKALSQAFHALPDKLSEIGIIIKDRADVLMDGDK